MSRSSLSSKSASAEQLGEANFEKVPHAMLTSILQFESTVTNVIKIDESALAIIMGSTIMICSPFRCNRALSGMHNIVHRAEAPIIGAASCLIDASLCMKALAEYDPSAVRDSHVKMIPQLGVAAYLSRGLFSILDCARGVEISKFSVNDLQKGETIVDFCGSQKHLFELAVLTNRRLLLLEFGLDEFTVKEQREFEDGVSIVEYDRGYLVNCQEGLMFYNEGKCYAMSKRKDVSDFRCDGTKIILGSVMKRKMVFRVQGGGAFGLMQMHAVSWDVAAGYIVCLHGGNLLSFVRIENVKARTTILLSERVEDQLSLTAAYQPRGRKIVVFIATPSFALAIDAPLDLLKKGDERVDI